MKPALRKQLFERWKECGSVGLFNEFKWKMEFFEGLVHVLVDGHGQSFNNTWTRLGDAIDDAKSTQFLRYYK